MDKEIGIVTVLIKRLEKQRLPRILSLKKKVDRGERLNGMDLDFLEKVMSDAKKVLPWIDKNPEFQLLATKVVGLYNEITEKGLKLEQNAK